MLLPNLPVDNSDYRFIILKLVTPFEIGNFSNLIDYIRTT